MKLIWTRHPLSQVNYDLVDTLSGWEGMEDSISGTDTTGASTYIAPTPDEIASSSGVGTAISAGSSILGGIGAYMQGQEVAGADEYNAQLALMEGQFNVEQLDLGETQTLSTQRAMYARAGVEMSGSVLDTALQTATQYEYSKQVATFNAQSEANMDQYEAEMAKSQGSMGLASGLLGAAGKLI